MTSLYKTLCNGTVDLGLRHYAQLANLFIVNPLVEGRGKNRVGTLDDPDCIPPAYVGGQRGVFGLTWNRERNVPDVEGGLKPTHTVTTWFRWCLSPVT